MIELIDTNSSKIAAEFVRARTRAGSPAMGMVMTLVIVAPEDDCPDLPEFLDRVKHPKPGDIVPTWPRHSGGLINRKPRSRTNGRR